MQALSLERVLVGKRKALCSVAGAHAREFPPKTAKSQAPARGKIPAELWTRKNTEWNLEESGPASYLPTARKLLELSTRLETLYISAEPLERRELVDSVCSNLFLHEKKLTFTYKKPFNLWAEGLHSANWLRD